MKDAISVRDRSKKGGGAVWKAQSGIVVQDCGRVEQSGSGGSKLERSWRPGPLRRQGFQQ